MPLFCCCWIHSLSCLSVTAGASKLTWMLFVFGVRIASSDAELGDTLEIDEEYRDIG